MKIEDYYVLFNPISGNGKAKVLVKKLISDLEKQQLTYKLIQSDYPGHAKKICKKLQNYKKIIKKLIFRARLWTKFGGTYVLPYI